MTLTAAVIAATDAMRERLQQAIAGGYDPSQPPCTDVDNVEEIQWEDAEGGE